MRDRKEINSIARARYIFKINHGARDAGKIRKDIDSIEINALGVSGEFAVAKYLGLEMDKSISLKGDEGFDLLWNNLRIEIKTTTCNHGNLIFNNMGHFKADIAILAILNGKFVKLQGWITRRAFEEIHEERDFGYGPRLFVRAENLRSMEFFEEELRDVRCNQV